MIRTTSLRKFFGIALVAIALLISTTFGNATALAVGETHATGAAPFPKGESTDINGSYHRLQEATQDYRNDILDDYSDRFLQADKTANKNRSPQQRADSSGNPLERLTNSAREKLNLDK